MSEFVALRPKMYSYKIGSKESTAGRDEVKKCKGIKKCIVKKDIKFEDYKICLMTGEMEHRSQLTFISKLHRISMIKTNKLALSREDDKRTYINNINSLARGHYALRVGPLDSRR